MRRAHALRVRFISDAPKRHVSACPLRSRTVGSPQSGSDPGLSSCGCSNGCSPLGVYPRMAKNLNKIKVLGGVREAVF
jgi:hypothetical protein